MNEKDCDRLSKELMRRFQAKDRDAMGELYELHNKAVRKEISKQLHTGSRERLDEVSQDVWLAVVERSGSYKETRIRFLTWLLEVVASVCAEIRRDEYAREVLHEDLEVRARWADPERTPEEEIEHQALVLDADRAIDILPLSERQVFRLREEEELTWAEIARAFGCSITTVRRYYFSALERMASVLEEYVPEGSSPPVASDDPSEEEEPRDAA